MNVAFSRHNTPLKVLRDGVVIGEIHRAKNNRNFVLTLHGVYWRKGRPVSSGNMCIWTDTLGHAKVIATVHADLARVRLNNRCEAGPAGVP